MIENARERARRLFARRPHWSILATALAAVEGEPAQVLAWGFPSTRAWAINELDLSPSSFVELSKLHDAMDQHGHSDLWAAVPKARALTLLPILALGGGARRWLLAAATLPGPQWAAELQKVPQPGRWDRWTIAWPRDCVETREAALIRIAEGLGIAAERIHDREVEHRLLLPLLEAVLGVTEVQAKFPPEELPA